MEDNTGPRPILMIGNQRYAPADTEKAAFETVDLQTEPGVMTVHTSHTTKVDRKRLKNHRKEDYKSMKKTIDLLRRMGYDIPDTGVLKGFFKQCHPTAATIVQIADNGDTIYFRTATATQHHKDLDRHGKRDSLANAMMKLYGRRFRKLAKIPQDHQVQKQIPLEIIRRVDVDLAAEIDHKKQIAAAKRSEAQQHWLCGQERVEFSLPTEDPETI